MQQPKNILTVFLLAALGFSLMLPVFLQLQQPYVKWQMREALEQQQLVQLKVKTNAIQWVNKDRECMINGELFDVKSKTTTNNETILTGLFDKKETAIKNTIEKQNRNKRDENKWKQIVKLYSVLSYSNQTQTILHPLTTIKNKSVSLQVLFYKQPVIRISAPPPELV